MSVNVGCISVCAPMCMFSRVQLFCDPMAYSLPGSSLHRIFQAGILEWVAIYPPPGNLPDLGIEMSFVSLALTGGFLTTAPTGKPWLH